MESAAVQKGGGDFPRVIRVIRICRKCGARIFADAAEGLCPGCVLEAAITSPEDFEGENAGFTETAAVLGELGDYELLEEIGRGGQGVVFRARQKGLNRIVALKVIGLGQWATRAHLRRFRREAEAAASLDHPGIVPIYEVGERGGSCYFSMKLIEGGQLQEVVRQKPVPIRQAAELIAKIARTVQYAHEHGILHRDIKPGNVLLDGKGEPHLTDFGLARLIESEGTITRTLDVMGTPSYMAPEQATGNNAAVGRATDVYGLGAVFYQLLTGHPPFAGGTTYETIKLLLESEPRPPRLWNRKVDRDLSTVCLKCLEKEPASRYPSALALAEDLEHWLRHEPIAARRTGLVRRGAKWTRRNPASALLAAALIALAASVGSIFWNSGLNKPPLGTGIAVLPFENLSADKDNSYFAAAVQDEILSDLAKVADLKVISRTSANLYKPDKPRNSREIGQQLGVTHLLEGNVQRIGNRVRINAQLIDARTDAHLWAQVYDRELADTFAIQNEIAQTIADQLQAKISAREKAAMAQPPTRDVLASNLYQQAIAIESRDAPDHDLHRAIRLLEEAVARDTNFVRAYCALARLDLVLYDGPEHTPARLEKARRALEKSTQLAPDAGEVHLVRARYLARVMRDYDGARLELELARRLLPNDAGVYYESALMDRRQGRGAEALQHFDRAIELDPLNTGYLWDAADTCSGFRNYAKAVRLCQRALALDPHDNSARLFAACQPLSERADTRPLRKELNTVLAEDSGAASSIFGYSWSCAILERNAEAADRALATAPEESRGYSGTLLPREWFQGYTDWVFNRPEMARSAFVAAAAILEKHLRDTPDDALSWSLLGKVRAALGQKQGAIAAGRRACDLMPLSKEPNWGLEQLKRLAVIYAWVGEKDLALQLLNLYAGQPRFNDYGEFKLHPDWDALRGDPRFEKIVASLAPPTGAHR